MEYQPQGSLYGVFTVDTHVANFSDKVAKAATVPNLSLIYDKDHCQYNDASQTRPKEFYVG